MKSLSYKNAESGLVAIFSVIFFIALITVITIGFLRIMLQEERQSADNQLAASALNAAEAGVEDAKRLILRCLNNPPSSIASECDSAFAQTSCPGILSSGTLRNDLDLTYNTTDGVQVSGDSQYNQYYTCVFVNLESEEYLDELDGPGDSVFVPLRSTSSYDTIEFSWHDTRPEADGPAVAYPPIFQLPKQPEWEGGQYPSFMRLQYMQHDDVFNVDDLEADSRTVFLTPAITSPYSNNSFDLEDVDFRTGTRSKNSPVPVQCIPTGSTAERFACTARISLSGFGPKSNAYLRVTSLYGGSNFMIRLMSGSTPVAWDGVQPVVDSTGKTNDVFRRVEARVRLDSLSTMPNHALESGTDLCKDFLVTDSASDYADDC